MIKLTKKELTHEARVRSKARKVDLQLLRCNLNRNFDGQVLYQLKIISVREMFPSILDPLPVIEEFLQRRSKFFGSYRRRAAPQEGRWGSST